MKLNKQVIRVSVILQKLGVYILSNKFFSYTITQCSLIISCFQNKIELFGAFKSLLKN